MILSDSDILRALNSGELVIDPIDLAEQIQPASVDVKLGDEFIRWNSMHGMNGSGRVVIDAREKPRFDMTDALYQPDCVKSKASAEHGIVLAPGEFVLGTTAERVKIPNNISATVEGRSSIGRLGIAVHVTAGFIDPGFEGQITFEIVNFNPNPVRIYPGMRVAQLVFARMQNAAMKPYSGKYQGQVGTTASKAHEDFEDFDTCNYCGSKGSHFRNCSRPSRS